MTHSNSANRARTGEDGAAGCRQPCFGVKVKGGVFFERSVGWSPFDCRLPLSETSQLLCWLLHWLVQSFYYHVEQAGAAGEAAQGKEAGAVGKELRQKAPPKGHH